MTATNQFKPKPMYRRLALGVALATGSLSVQAAPPTFQDTRAMGMGGTGVASARPSGAGFINPALLANQHGEWHDDFALTLPSANARFADDEDVPDEIDAIQDTILALESSLSDLQSAGDIEDVQSEAGRLADQLADVDGDTMRGDLGVGTSLASPDPNIAIGFHASGQLRASIQGQVDPDDIDALRTFAEADSPDPTDPEVQDALDTVENPGSRGRVLASAVVETGLSFARQFQIQNERVSIGVTPKYVQLRTFDYVENVDDFDDDDFDASEHETKESNLNLNVGASMQLGENDQWTLGGSVRDLIPMSLDGRERIPGDNEDLEIDQRELNIRPQVTVGVAHSSGWHTLAADLELNKREAFGYEADSQFLSLGGEVNVIDWINVRGGLRQNLASEKGADGIEEKTQLTAGVALSPWALRIEAGALVSADEIGASAELGMSF